jgi:SAM-dependent methyltransferase
VSSPVARTERLAEAIRAGLQGSVPPNIALMRALVEAQAPADLDRALAQARADPTLIATPEAAGRLDAIEALWRARPEAWALVHGIAAAADHAALGATPIARWAETFDRLAAFSPDAAVALYALGDPDLLARATAEIVARLDQWGLIGPERDAVEIGCGSGRFVQALAPRLRSVAGSDISAAMVVEARRRCAGLTNVRLDPTAGEGLPQHADGSADLILAVDVFPYLVLAGGDVAARHVAEAQRVLRPGGSLVLLNYSYRGDPALDRADVSRLAGQHRLEVRRVAAGDFSLWDGTTFWLAKPPGPTA